MKKTRRTFDKAFKMMVAELLESDKSTNEVSEDLGVKVDYIRRWRREYKAS